MRQCNILPMGGRIGQLPQCINLPFGPSMRQLRRINNLPTLQEDTTTKLHHLMTIFKIKLLSAIVIRYLF